MEEYTPRSLREIGNICNIPDRQRLRFVDEHSYLICIHPWVKDKYVLSYYIPMRTRDFCFDPNRSPYLYSTSLVIDKCREAIKSLICDTSPYFRENVVLVHFFMPTLFGKMPTVRNIANATRLLESATNESDRKELLLFLNYLSGIHWFGVYNGGRGRRHFTHGIVHWLCTTLVS